ncbi:hypothetical protein HQ32_02222 [Prauserella sp. Am3]|nr:hypothetical protein HQ32_02222 [Prauserella sp. Am3]
MRMTFHRHSPARPAAPVRSALLTAVLALVLMTVACSGDAAEQAHPEAAPVTATQRVTVEPFTPDGAPSPRLTVTDEADAKCSASGVDLSDPTARRCMTTEGYLLYDPCYVRPGPTPDTALCLREPDSTDAVRIHLVEDAGPLPPEEITQRPWYLQLEDGRRCVLAPRPDPTDPAEQPTYTCGKGDHLFGMPDTSAPVWTIGNRQDTDTAGGTGDAESALREVDIRTAWF